MMEKTWPRALCWFRRDLRAEDHAALYLACRSAQQVYCCFVFDTDILDALPRADRRVEFIHACVVELDAQLRELGLKHGVAGAGLIVRHGSVADELPRLAAELRVQAVYANHDADPDGVARDVRIRGALSNAGIVFHTAKDHVVFERDEVLTAGGTPYTVFTPYKDAWLKKLDDFFLSAWPVERHAAALAPCPDPIPIPSLLALGFEPTDLDTAKLPPGSSGAQLLFDDFLTRIDHYGEARDYPAVKGPSYLGPHLRFGTLSIRRAARAAWDRMQGGSQGAAVWLSELAWRDFFHQILHHHPRVVGHAFREPYDAIQWEKGRHADALFDAWRSGRTGYPLVDAAMLQLDTTGYMHNRLRMVTASFLVKDLGIDWRRGEAWFAEKLNDYDLANNNGGWQWAASTGCDAQPYFRIFNPMTQSQRYDPEGRFIVRYLPQLATLPPALRHAPWQARPVELAAAGVEIGVNYPAPLVDHAEARSRTIERYAVALKGQPGKSRSKR